MDLLSLEEKKRLIWDFKYLIIRKGRFVFSLRNSFAGYVKNLFNRHEFVYEWIVGFYLISQPFPILPDRMNLGYWHLCYFIEEFTTTSEVIGSADVGITCLTHSCPSSGSCFSWLQSSAESDLHQLWGSRAAWVKTLDGMLRLLELNLFLSCPSVILQDWFVCLVPHPMTTY